MLMRLAGARATRSPQRDRPVVRRWGRCTRAFPRSLVTTVPDARFRPRRQRSAYVATGEPMDKAGRATGSRGSGSRRWSSRFDGDYYAVVGFPVAAVPSSPRPEAGWRLSTSGGGAGVAPGVARPLPDHLKREDPMSASSQQFSPSTRARPGATCHRPRGGRSSPRSVRIRSSPSTSLRPGWVEHDANEIWSCDLAPWPEKPSKLPGLRTRRFGPSASRTNGKRWSSGTARRWSRYTTPSSGRIAVRPGLLPRALREAGHLERRARSYRDSSSTRTSRGRRSRWLLRDSDPETPEARAEAGASWRSGRSTAG